MAELIADLRVQRDALQNKIDNIRSEIEALTETKWFLMEQVEHINDDIQRALKEGKREP